MNLVSAVIINHNNKELLIRCIESLKGQSLKPDEILVFDNASTDGTVRAIDERFSDIKIIQNDRNLGFSLSCNRAINLVTGEFILLLNNDVVLAENFIKALLGAMQSDRAIGIAGGKVLSYDGKYIDSAGQLLARSRKIIDRGYREIDNARYDKSGYIFSISASAALYRRTMLEDVGENNEYFDEDFGRIFYEDMDLAWRAQKKGWRAYYQPQATAYHKRGATNKQKHPRFIFLKKYYIPHLNTELQSCAIRNRYLMMLKNDTAGDILKDLPFILWYEIKQAFYLLLFNPAIIIYILKDRVLFFRSLRKRR